MVINMSKRTLIYIHPSINIYLNSEKHFIVVVFFPHPFPPKRISILHYDTLGIAQKRFLSKENWAEILS